MDEFKFQILKSADFNEWFSKQNPIIQDLISARFLKIINYGHFGSINFFDGLIELKWKSGLRIYLARTDRIVIIALGGGNKNGQDKDIKRAKKILKEIQSHYINKTWSIWNKFSKQGES